MFVLMSNINIKWSLCSQPLSDITDGVIFCQALEFGKFTCFLALTSASEDFLFWMLLMCLLLFNDTKLTEVTNSVKDKTVCL